MRFTIYHPSSILQPYVKHYWVLEITANDLPYSQHLMPYGWFELFFYLKGQPKLESGNAPIVNLSYDSIFTGQLSQSRVLNHSEPFRAAGISLQPWAGNVLFGIPANHFADGYTNFEDIDRNTGLREQLLACHSDEGIVEVFEKYLLKKLNGNLVDQVSAFVAQSIRSQLCTQNLHQMIVSQIGLSQRRIEQRFLSSTGVTMSFFTSISRNDKVLDLFEKDQQWSLTQIGLAAGYYDQSHFIREFKKFSNFTPGAYAKKVAQMGEMERSLILG